MKRSLFYFVIFLGYLVASCECEDCGPIAYNPVFKARFINSDSLLVLTESLEELTSSSNDLQDTLDKIDIILAGTENPDSIEDFTSLKSFYTSEKTIVDSLKLIVNNKEDSVAAGYNIIERLTNLDNGNSIVPDTIHPHSLPLPLVSGSGEARYELLIDGQLLKLGVFFEASENINNFGEVNLTTSEVTIDESFSTFDSVYFEGDEIFILEF